MNGRKNRYIWLAICMLIMALAVTSSVAGATIYVDLNGARDFNSIQAAIDDANDGDEIEVAPGTYNEAINFNGKAVRLYSSDGPDVTTINGNGAYHVVQCVSGEDANTILEGFTITGGNANGSDPNDKIGGGMLNFSSSPTVTNCTISNNTATDGGGMYNFWDSSPTVTGCIFSGNSTKYGGGMYNKDSSPTVTNCNFSGNSAEYSGGGMCNYNSNPTATNCNFSGNSAGIYGGGMCNISNSSLTATNCIFSSNSADYGGGMCNYGHSTPIVTNCIFSGNLAEYSGGGMCNYYYGNPTVTNCTFSSNTAIDYGGGMYNVFNSSLTVTNCIFWGDTPNEIINSASSPTIAYSDVQGGYNGTGNIDADPCFVDPSRGDFRLLLFASPCVDAGDNNAPNLPLIDLAGNPRILDGDGDGNSIVDMGAFEFYWVCNITQGRSYIAIQPAINDANNGDEIIVSPGTYYENINFHGKAISLYSSDGPEVTTIDANGAYHTVQCVNGEDANTVLEGFTITGGNATNGGGMYNSGSSPTVSNCTFTGNKASSGGGGMSNVDNSPTVNNCTFSGNSANSTGGGMENRQSSAVVNNCTFSSNSTNYGGGIYNYESYPTVTNCKFSGNSAEIYGGGMRNYQSSPTVTNCAFSSNTAVDYGGGMANSGSSNPVVTNCTFSGNSANSGGGMRNWQSSIPTLTNCILWGNTLSQIYGERTISYSNVEGGMSGTGNIDADPYFVDAGGGDFRLSSISPCIDAGDNSAPNLPPTDLAGSPRILDGDCNSIATVDMGAFELNWQSMGDFDDNCCVDFLDFSTFALAWMTKQGDPGWDWVCDISEPLDDYIDWRDMAILCQNWLATP